MSLFKVKKEEPKPPISNVEQFIRRLGIPKELYDKFKLNFAFDIPRICDMSYFPKHMITESEFEFILEKLGPEDIERLCNAILTENSRKKWLSREEVLDGKFQSPHVKLLIDKGSGTVFYQSVTPIARDSMTPERIGTCIWENRYSLDENGNAIEDVWVDRCLYNDRDYILPIQERRRNVNYLDGKRLHIRVGYDRSGERKDSRAILKDVDRKKLYDRIATEDEIRLLEGVEFPEGLDIDINEER